MTATKKPKKPTQKGKLQILGSAIMLVIRGCQNGSIKSRPIINMSPDAESIEPKSLEERMWEALVDAGLFVKKKEGEQP